MSDVPPEVARQLNLEEEHPERGLAQLVLALVNLLHELLEKQAIRRMEAGRLTDDEIDRLGRTLMRQAQALDDLRQHFGLTHEEIDLLLDLNHLVESSPADHDHSD